MRKTKNIFAILYIFLFVACTEWGEEIARVDFQIENNNKDVEKVILDFFESSDFVPGDGKFRYRYLREGSSFNKGIKIRYWPQEGKITVWPLAPRAIEKNPFVKGLLSKIEGLLKDSKVKYKKSIYKYREDFFS